MEPADEPKQPPEKNERPMSLASEGNFSNASEEKNEQNSIEEIPLQSSEGDSSVTEEERPLIDSADGSDGRNNSQSRNPSHSEEEPSDIGNGRSTTSQEEKRGQQIGEKEPSKPPRRGFVILEHKNKNRRRSRDSDEEYVEIENHQWMEDESEPYEQSAMTRPRVHWANGTREIPSPTFGRPWLEDEEEPYHGSAATNRVVRDTGPRQKLPSPTFGRPWLEDEEEPYHGSAATNRVVRDTGPRQLPSPRRPWAADEEETYDDDTVGGIKDTGSSLPDEAQMIEYWEDDLPPGVEGDKEFGKNKRSSSSSESDSWEDSPLITRIRRNRRLSSNHAVPAFRNKPKPQWIRNQRKGRQRGIHHIVELSDSDPEERNFDTYKPYERSALTDDEDNWDRDGSEEDGRQRSPHSNSSSDSSDSTLERPNMLFITATQEDMLAVKQDINSPTGWSLTTYGTREMITNVNCTDSEGRSALRIAINNRSTRACKLLLEMGVDIGSSLFHAIKQNFPDGVKAILEYEKTNNIRSCALPSSDYYFPGFTPIILASYCNSYKMAKLLLEYGYKLEETSTSEGVFWESANERKILCKAQSSPAYITALAEVSGVDPFKHCMDLIETIRKNAKMEPQHSEFYCRLEDNVEKYMCSLLYEVRSSDVLLSLFQCETQKSALDTSKHISHLGRVVKRLSEVSSSSGDVESQKNGVDDGEMDSTDVKLQLVDRSVDMRLLKFVTHSNTQQCLDYMNYKGARYMHQGNLIKWLFINVFVGLLFPFLSLLHLAIPQKWVGKMIRQPAIGFACHLISDLSFVILIFINVAIRSVENDYLGSPPTVVEWLILFWVIGKWRQEYGELRFHGAPKYFADWWNVNDIAQLVLISTSIILRTVEFFQHINDTTKTPRSKWAPTELRLISEALLSWAYIFVCLRVLNLIRTIRRLGPLQLSLARMITNIIEFLFIFALIVIAFALSLSELYWYYGTAPGKQLFCSSGNATAQNCTSNVLFTDIGNSLQSLYWTIFGYLDLSKVSLSGKYYVTEGFAWSLVAFYHVVVLIVLINMLIAMMSQTYEETSANAEVEWKLHRAEVWLRFIRRENVLPPPMNILPNVRWMARECARRRKCEGHGKKKDCDFRSRRIKLRKEAINMLLQRYKYNRKLR